MRTENQQADAMEFFTFMLDTLHEEMRSIDCSVKNNNIKNMTLNCDNDDDDDWEEVGKGNRKVNIDVNQSKRVATDVISSSVISQTFHGSLRSTVIYEKKKTTSVTYQRFHCLQLDIRNATVGAHKSSNCVTLSDALKNYFKEEVRVGLSFYLYPILTSAQCI